MAVGPVVGATVAVGLSVGKEVVLALGAPVGEVLRIEVNGTSAGAGSAANG